MASVITPNHYMNTTYCIERDRPGRFRAFCKLNETLLSVPLTVAKLALRTLKLLTLDTVMTIGYTIGGYHKEGVDHFRGAYLKTVQVARDVLFTPSIAMRSVKDMVATRESLVDDLCLKEHGELVRVDYVTQFNPLSSYLHGTRFFEVMRPKGITEFPATTDPTLQTVMASHIFRPGVLGINFGTPNVAAFITKKETSGEVQTVKVDAKSLRRAEMTYHETNGKMQSGIFLIPDNLPAEALERFEAAAKKMAGRKDITCVNTNCRVLQEAGFGIEGVNLEDVVFPNTFMEHLLFRNVFYTDTTGIKHKIHFKILNTTDQRLEAYFAGVDTAVVGTRFRHNARHADTETAQKVRGAAAKALIAEEAARLKEADTSEEGSGRDLRRRKVSVSVPSFFGNLVARFTARHTLYEIDLSADKERIVESFTDKTKLRPFPQVKPSLATRIKRDFFFSQPMINFLRRHIMGHSDNMMLDTCSIFKHLQSTEGERFNYVIMDDKIVIARVHANGAAPEAHKRAADWALSKHALLAGRRDVYCSGEMWYDPAKKRFMLNGDSGTYVPTQESVHITAHLVNRLFDTKNFQVATA